MQQEATRKAEEREGGLEHSHYGDHRLPREINSLLAINEDDKRHR